MSWQWGWVCPYHLSGGGAGADPQIAAALEATSSHIVTGKVTDVSTFKTEAGGIKTRVTVAVSSISKGDLSNGQLVVEFDGGAVGNDRMDIFAAWVLGDGLVCTGYPEFTPGEAVELYLQEDGDVFRLSYGELGKVKPDRAAGSVDAAGGDGYQRYPYKWGVTPAAPVVNYRINQQGTVDIPNIDPNANPPILRDEFTVLPEAFDVWQADVGSFISFNNLGTTAVLPDIYTPDGLSVIGFRSDHTPPNWYAGTNRWQTYDPDSGTYFITEADIALNDAFWWSIDATPPPPSRVDVLNILVHEVGHFLGLQHVSQADDLYETMYPETPLGKTYWRTLWWGDIAGVRKAYPNQQLAGAGLGWDSQDGDIAIGHIGGDAAPDLILARINNGQGNYIFYWVGYDLDATTGQVPPGNWSNLRWYPNWIGEDSAGLGAALTNIDADPRPDLVLVWVNIIPFGPDDFYYSVGMNLNADGWPTHWTPVTSRMPIDSWEIQGAGVAMANLDADPRPDMVVNWIEYTGWGNRIRYRVFWNMNDAGQYASPSAVLSMPDYIGDEQQGAGIAIVNYDADADPEHPNPSQTLDYVMFWVDDNPGENMQWYRVGWNIGANGQAGSWSREFRMDEGEYGENSAGGGIANFNLDADGRPDLTVMWVDNPPNDPELPEPGPEDYLRYGMA